MNIGERINQFDNTNGTVGEFNKLFPYAPIKGKKNVEVEILEIPMNKPYHRKLLINGKVIEHDLFPRKKENRVTRKDKGRPMKTAKYRYLLYHKGKLIDQSGSMKGMACYFDHHDQHVSRVLWQKGEYINGEYRLIRKLNKKEKK